MQLRTSVLCVLAACQAGRSAEPTQPPAVAPSSSAAVPMPVFSASQYAMQQEASPPWSLTASDGSGLQLVRVDARASFQGPLAFTELHLYFHNPENRIREGTFAITLPAHAAVSRFAMESNNEWLEAEVVERQLARRAYEDFLHRRQDPALLEKAAGNQFTARVFPIAANADKHLVLSYSQELPGERYVLPLRGLPKVGRVDVALSLLGADGKRTEQKLSQHDWQPDGDFVSSAPLVAEAVSSGTLVAAQLPIVDRSGVAQAMDAPAAVTLLVDTSASRALGFANTVATVDKMIAGLRKQRGDALPLQVIAYDQDTQEIFTGRAADWGDAGKKALLARGAAGASDLGQAFAWLHEAQHPAKSRVVIVTDGVLTAGQDAKDLAMFVPQGVERVDVVLAGGIRDEQVASTLVRSAKQPGAVLDLEQGADAVVAALHEKVLVDVAIDVTGASWVYPRTIPSARAGTRIMVYAQLPAVAQTFDAIVNGTHRAVGMVGGTQALVERAVAAAQIDELEAKLAGASGDAAKALRTDIAKRAIAARVVSSQTSMLVLETTADYERFGIQRTALADILEVVDGTVVQHHRTNTPAAIAIASSPPGAKVRMKGDEKQKHGEVDDEKKELALADKNRDVTIEQGSTAQGITINEIPPSTGAFAGDAGGMPSSHEMPDPAEERAPAIEPVRISGNTGSAASPPPPPPPPPPTTTPVVPRPPSQPAPATRRVVRDVVGTDGPVERLQLADGRPQPLEQEAWPPKGKPEPLTGELAAISKSIAAGDPLAALAKARAWHAKAPGDVLALIALGEALEAKRDLAEAARAYGSIIDLFPSRADLRRFAGERLERIADTHARTESHAGPWALRSLAIDTYRRAVADRPDHMTGHRLLAYALLRDAHQAEAFAAILAGIDQKYPSGRFPGGDRVLADDAGLIGAAYALAVPAKRKEIEAELAKRNAKLATSASTRFILYWETDANDVDFHIQDARGGHAWYSSKQLPSGGELYADVTTGYGPECFAIPGTPKAGPYKLSLDYYRQGPMGYGMGLLQIVVHDGKGNLHFEDRPYVIMADHAYVDLGTYK